MRKLFLLLPCAALMAQTAPPANVQMQNGSSRATTPVVNYCSDGSTWSPCSSISGGGGGGGSGADVGTTGTAAPASANQTAGRTASGNLVATCVDSTGKACAPVAGVANRVITKTSVAANTSTVICPTATTPVYVEIQINGGGLGLGINGQTLTSAALGTTTSSADIVLPNALSTYIPPVAPTNAITGYGPAQIVTCIQTLRQ